MDFARTPPTWHTTVDEIWSAVYRGVPMIVDESARSVRDELDMTQNVM
jgi:hypothetical protein